MISPSARKALKWDPAASESRIRLKWRDETSGLMTAFSERSLTEGNELPQGGAVSKGYSC